MISFLSCQNWRAKWATPVLVTNERPAFIPCTLLCAHESNSPPFIHPSPTLLFEYTQNNTNMASNLFSFDLTLSSSPLYLSLGYLAVFSCNHMHLVGARLILPSSVATYNTALKLPKLVHWRLEWAPGVPLWPPSTMVADRHFCLQC